MIILPNFDPVIFSIGPLAIRWYSLAYVAGIIFTFIILKKFNLKNKIMSEKALDDWMMWMVFGIVIGGRLGYVFLYNFDYYFHNPLSIIAIWEGGMSFHGGLAGSIISMFLFCKKYKIEFFKLTDILALCAPIGLFFGRIANFINMELYGRVTTSKFGVIFPNAGELPRHPSQIYEALCEGLLTFLILASLVKFTKILNKKGITSGLFLLLYSICRISLEQFREPDEQIGFLFGNFTMGQLLSTPMMLAGLIIILYSATCKTQEIQADKPKSNLKKSKNNKK